MKKEIGFTRLENQSKAEDTVKAFTAQKANKVRDYHASVDGYTPTPLVRLDKLAQAVGVGAIYVKDESCRFGLNAFKGLGGSYALARIISDKTGRAVGDFSGVEPHSYTFVTATDGNHGRGVAWAAKNLGQNAVVYLPKGSAEERLENILKLGAHAEITDMNYDDTVRFAKAQAEKNGWTLVQDTAWEGYEQIPLYIMQGYMTMALEAVEALGDTVPTHVFLQAGVGAMAGAVTAFIANRYPDNMPKIIIVEPNKADCHYQTAVANDGELHSVDGDLDSIMAGLCCGEVCTVAWDILKNNAEYYFSVPDYIAADGMRILACPVGDDTKIISGESGAATTGLVYNLMTDNELNEYKEKIGLCESSVVLCISTEGDTDRENWRRIVLEGKYSRY